MFRIKLSIKKNCFKFFYFVCFLLFISCKNFFGGSEIANELEKEMEYANASAVTATITKENIDDNSTIEPAGAILNKKVGYEFDISYTPSSTYYFVEWKAYNSKNEEYTSQQVFFKNERAAKTSVTVNVTESVFIKAVGSPVPKAGVSFSKNIDVSGELSTLETQYLLMGEETSISFKENSDYQFIKWIASNDNVEIENPYNTVTKITGMNDGAVTVTAISAARPKVTGGNTLILTDSVCKDTSIFINFDKNLSKKNDLSEIAVYYNGSKLFYGDEEPFGEPYFAADEDEILYNQIIIPANKKYALNVEAGKTPSVRVVIPGSLYYENSDYENSKIYFGTEDYSYSWTYKINSQTNTKVQVLISYPENLATITGNKDGSYNIGETLEIQLKEKKDSQFIKWDIVCVPSDLATVVKNYESGEQKLSVKLNDSGSININAVLVERPSLDSSYGIKPENSKSGVNFDSDFSIRFAKEINKDSLESGIKISCGDDDLSEYFDIEFENQTGNGTADENTYGVTLKAPDQVDKIIELRKLLNIAEGSTKTVKITIPKENIFYEVKSSNDNVLKVTAADDFYYAYAINNESSQKDKVLLTFKLESINGTVSNAEYKTYVSSTINLLSTPKDGYAFICWKLYAADGITELPIEDYFEMDSIINSQNIKVKKSGTNLILRSFNELRPQVSLTKPANGKEGLVRNTAINIVFTQSMKISTLSKDSGNIKVTQGIERISSEGITMDSKEVTDLNYSFTTDGKMLTLSLEEGKLYQSNAYITVTVSENVKNDKGIKLGNEYQLKFQVSNNVDSLAPVIQNMYVGIDSYEGLDSIKYRTYDATHSREIGKSLDEIKASYNAFKEDEVSDRDVNVMDNLLSTKKLKFYVHAEDIVGSGQNADSARIEANVTNIGYKITRVMAFNKKGNLAACAEGDFVYGSSVIYSTLENELKGQTIGEGEIQSGTTFTLDLTNLDGNGLEAPDGILKIDIYAIDKNGNSGYDDSMWYKYGNGYRTLFVVKDHKAPEITVKKWNKKLFEKDITAEHKNGVNNNAYIKFKIDEEMSGLASFDIELKDSQGQSVYRAENEGLKIKYFENSDTFNSAVDVGVSSRSASRINFNNVNAHNAKFRDSYSGWYYVTGLIDDDLEEGEYSLKITVTDAIGNSSVVETPIVVDRTAPYFIGGSSANPKNAYGPVVASYSYKDGNNAENVYPRVGNPGVTGAEFWDSPSIPNGDGNQVRWFYTNAFNSSSTYGVKVKQEYFAGDSNVSEDMPVKFVYKYHGSSTYTDDNLKKITLESFINSPSATKVLTSGESSSYEDYYGTGTRSFVAYDDAGNTSSVYTFVIVKDETGPEMVTNRGRDLKHLITVPVGQSGQPSYTFGDYLDETWDRHTTATKDYPFFDWWEGTIKHSTTKMWGRMCQIVGTSEQIRNAKYYVKLSGSANGNERTIYADGNPPVGDKVNAKNPYAGERWNDAKPSRTSSGISQYYLGRVYLRWRYDNTDIFLPALPPETNAADRFVKDTTKLNYTGAIYINAFSKESDRKYTRSYTSNSKYFDTWQKYTAGSDIEIPIFKDYGSNTSVIIKNSGVTYNKYWQPPISICFKDNCGNINYMMCTRPDWEEFAVWVYRIDEQR